MSKVTKAIRDLTHIVSIDPGSVHCGVAMWRREGFQWICDWAVEMTPEECVDYVFEVVNGEDNPSRIICEGFFLKPGLDALRQAGSTMGTVEVIGVVRHLCRWAQVEFQVVANGQQSIIARLSSVGYSWVSRGHGGHAKDAEAVGVRGLGLKVSELVISS